MKNAIGLWMLATMVALLPCGPAAGGLVEDEFGEGWTELDAEEADAELARLNAIWKKQRELPQTTYIRSRRINSGMRSMAREKLHALLDKAALVEDSANLVTLSRAVLEPPKPRIQRHGDYATQQLWADDELGRAEMNSGDRKNIIARGKAVTIRYSGHSEQVNLVPNANERVHFPGLDDFRFVPEKVLRASIKSIRQREGMLLLETSPTPDYEAALLIDAATGMPLRIIVVSRDGDIILERRQEGWTKCPEGVLYPRVHVEPSYDRQEQTKAIKIDVVEFAQFNHELRPTLFHVVAVPAGTTLVDERGADTEVRRLWNGTDDILRDANVAQ